MVEFALVLPLLLILLLGIADFGRVFTAGITLEAAVRDGAEAAGLERLHNPPTTPGDLAYYQNLHLLAARTVCHEAGVLPSSTPQLAAADPPTPPLSSDECPDFTGSSGTSYGGMPVIRVCVRDGVDPLCGQPIPGYGPTIPADPGTGASLCPQVQALATAPDASSGGDVVSHMIEVRACYHFTTLFNLHLSLPWNAGLNLGDVWLERTRMFVVDCPPGTVNAC